VRDGGVAGGYAGDGDGLRVAPVSGAKGEHVRRHGGGGGGGGCDGDGHIPARLGCQAHAVSRIRAHLGAHGSRAEDHARRRRAGDLGGRGRGAGGVQCGGGGDGNVGDDADAHMKPLDNCVGVDHRGDGESFDRAVGVGGEELHAAGSDAEVTVISYPMAPVAAKRTMHHLPVHHSVGGEVIAAQGDAELGALALGHRGRAGQRQFARIARQDGDGDAAAAGEGGRLGVGRGDAGVSQHKGDAVRGRLSERVVGDGPRLEDIRGAAVGRDAQHIHQILRFGVAVRRQLAGVAGGGQRDSQVPGGDGMGEEADMDDSGEIGRRRCRERE